MFANDFDDGDVTNWYEGPGGDWLITGSAGGEQDRQYYGSAYWWTTALTHEGMATWSDYDMSAEVWLINDSEAGIVFHADTEGNYYSFCVSSNEYTCQAWKSQDHERVPSSDPIPIVVTHPMVVRMTRVNDAFRCYANGTLVEFTDTTYPGGGIALQVVSGEATFNNVTVHGGTHFLDQNTGTEAHWMIDDPFNRLDLDGNPYMWSLFGKYENPPDPPESAWKVVDGGAGHGKVLQGTASADPNLATLALRGDASWINDDDETDYIDYYVEANVKLQSANDEAGIGLRAATYSDWPGFRSYELHLNGPDNRLEFRHRYWTGTQWVWSPPLDYRSVTIGTGWHTLAVEAESNITYTDFHCYLDGQHRFTVSASYWRDGLVGLWVQSGTASFDNVNVVDLRYTNP